MCRSLTYYPLCEDLDTHKQKVLFQYYYHCKDRESYNIFINRKFNLIEKKIIKDKNYRIVKWINVPCGCCDECLNDKARQWAYRILLEASRFKHNYFITLTYDDEHLPADRNLIKTEISDFNKKLKTYMKRKGLESDFRFYGVGEYGSKTARPHRSLS